MSNTPIPPLDEKSVVIDVRNDGPVRWVVPISVLRQVLGPAPSREEAHRDVIDSLRAMTSQEILASAIEAGIYDKDGNLTPEYGGEAAPLPSADRKGEP